jgi:RNA polymerase sigma-70 factor, ECF subfamily
VTTEVAEGLPLARAFLAGLPAQEPPLDRDAQDSLEVQLEAVLRACRDEWPGMDLADDAFVAHLAARLPPATEMSERIAAAHVADLYLACACAAGRPVAIARFEERVLPEVRRALARVDPSAAFADEIHQRLRQKLLVAEGGQAPKMAEYQGHGPLVHWLRAIAMREALKVQRRERREHELDPDAMMAETPARDLELEIIRSQHREDFRAAFEAAFRTLSARERNLLRMHVLDGLSIDQIGAFYRTHRTTAFRWLEAARDELARGIRRELAEKLKLSRAELDSLMGLVRSQLDVSIRKILERSS